MKTKTGLARTMAGLDFIFIRDTCRPCGKDLRQQEMKIFRGSFALFRFSPNILEAGFPRP
jgi:hypothetical protein